MKINKISNSEIPYGELNPGDIFQIQLHEEQELSTFIKTNIEKTETLINNIANSDFIYANAVNISENYKIAVDLSNGNCICLSDEEKVKKVHAELSVFD